MRIQKAKVLATVLGGTLVAISTLAAAESFSVDDAMLATAGEFELGNGETRMIASSKHDETYRLCVRQSRYSVPVKVIYDGKERTVSSGNCADFEAMDIEVKPGGKLAEDSVLIGKYSRLRK